MIVKRHKHIYKSKSEKAEGVDKIGFINALVIMMFKLQID